MTFSAKEVAEFLEELRTLDSNAISALFNNYVPCSQDTVNHDHVIVDGSDEKPTLGVLGLINGLLTKCGSKEVIYVIKDESSSDKVLGFGSANKFHFR